VSPWYRWDGADLVLSVQVQPRAGHNAITGPHGEYLKIRLAAPPVEGRANAELVAFLAQEFGVRREDVEILRGDTARRKVVRIRRPKHRPIAVPRTT
jgi:uncharacterized protein (TIGR00251 family)